MTFIITENHTFCYQFNQFLHYEVLFMAGRFDGIFHHGHALRTIDHHNIEILYLPGFPDPILGRLFLPDRPDAPTAGLI